MIYKNVFFDFDGVLCQDYPFQNLAEFCPEAYRYVEEEIFGGGEVADQWMRGVMNTDDINGLIGENCGLALETLKRLFKISVQEMKLDQNMLALVKRLKNEDVAVALVTDNMDYFDELIVPAHNLGQIFGVIVNSFRFGCLKHERGGRLFDVALGMLGGDDFRDSLLIDDSLKACQVFAQKGGQKYLFDNFHNFKDWLFK